MTVAVRAALLAAVCAAARSQTPDIGSGQVDQGTRWSFSAAYVRNGFSSVVSLPPVGDVRRFGATGLVQEFRDAARTENVRLGLVKASTLPGIGDGSDVFQVRAPLFNYYTSVGPNTAGYPSGDSRSCPAGAPDACTWAIFDKNHVLFAFERPLLNGQNFTVSDPFYTKWMAAGGIGGLGAAITAEQTVASSRSGAAAAVQTFHSGAIYEITSGLQVGRVFAVSPQVYPLYATHGGHAGFLGLPAGDELAQPGGTRRQTFEGGAIEYAPGAQPVLRLPVASVTWRPVAGTIRMQLGEMVTLEAVTYDPLGGEITGRTVSFVSSNNRVAAVEARGSQVSIRAVGGGMATVTAVSEGRSAPPVMVFVTAPCCRVGEGAPNATVQSAFEQAIARAQLNIRLPAAAPVQRTGAGYLQEFQSSDASQLRYVVAIGDRVGVAYVLSGDIAEKFFALGGPTGPLGYPTSDAINGRQLFEGGALAGSPVRRVTGLVLSKWAQLTYERGPAGMPAGEATAVLSSIATSAQVQQFAGGVIAASGNKAYFIAGPVAAAWQGAGAHRSALGLPVSDEFASAGMRQQEFEGGTIQYSPGSADVRVSERPRRPAVSATPATVPAGSRLRLAFSGFTPGTLVRVSVSGEPDFFVTSDSGAHTWEVWVPPDAPSRTVALRATTDSGIIALTTYNVRSRAETRVQLAKVAGDAQTGAPAAALPAALRIRATDDAGNAVAGLPVRWTASPGAAILDAVEWTDERGEAQARLSMPAGESVALATAEAGRQVATFSARATRFLLPNFPRLTHASAGGDMLAAAASILRYWQNRRELGNANGNAEPAALQQFLRGVCGLDASGAQTCDGFVSVPGSSAEFVNLWRLGAFVRGDVAINILTPDMASIRNAVAQGTPVLLAAPSGNGTRFLVAIGIEADGRLSVHDPAPQPGSTWDGRVAAAVAIAPGAAGGSGIVIRSSDEVSVQPAAGVCGRAIEWQSSGRPFRQQFCPDAREYHIELAAPASSAALSDTAAAGGQTRVDGATALIWSASRAASLLQIAPQTTRFEAAAVVNAASFERRLAPGMIASIFGSGLARLGSGTRLVVGGVAADVLSVSPFQVNFVVPAELTEGEHPLTVIAPFGALERAIRLEAAAPALFMIDARRGAVLNVDGALNGPTRPALRGSAVSLYGTGFSVAAPVVATLNGREVPVTYFGPAPEFAGLYQINIAVPENLAPDLSLPLVLLHAGRETSPVEVAVQ